MWKSITHLINLFSELTIYYFFNPNFASSSQPENFTTEIVLICRRLSGKGDGCEILPAYALIGVYFL